MTHTMTDQNTGTSYDLTGDTLQEIAEQAKALTEVSGSPNKTSETKETAI